MKMICPKAKGCENNICLHRNIQQPNTACPDSGKFSHFPCNCSCIPYEREFKKGDRVRVIGKSTGLSIEESNILRIGDIGRITHIYSEYVCVNNKAQGYGDHFLPQDLEHTGETMSTPMPEKPKYKATGKCITIPNLYQEDSGNCFLSHLASLMKITHPHDMKQVVRLNFVTLIGWAEKDPARIQWLLDKAYIEKVESDYDKWMRAWPGGMNQTAHIAWAKQMPREGE